MLTRRTSIDRIPLSIAVMHPAKQVIHDALLRRGDTEATAEGRAIALIDLLIRGRYIVRTKEQRVAQCSYEALE